MIMVLPNAALSSVSLHVLVGLKLASISAALHNYG